MQTTLGKGEHLKNPSITNLKKYRAAYYVPNNVAICLSGDFDPDMMIKTIKKYYVPQKLMSDDDVAKICSIIIGDKKLSAAETKRLLDAFTTVNTTKSQKRNYSIKSL